MGAMPMFPALVRMDSTPDQCRGPPLPMPAGSSSGPWPRKHGQPGNGQERVWSRSLISGLIPTFTKARGTGGGGGSPLPALPGGQHCSDSKQERCCFAFLLLLQIMS